MSPDAKRGRSRRIGIGRRLARGALVASLAATLGSATLAGASGTSGSTAVGQVLTTPSNREMPPYGVVKGVACPPGGGCVAVGSYIETGRDVNALIWSRASGRWHAAFRISSPRGIPSSDPSAFDDVACSSSGLCVAVGIADVDRSVAPIAERISGRVSRAVAMPPPTGDRELAESDSSSSVGPRTWCEPGDGRCIIVGSTIGGKGLLRAFISRVALDHPSSGWVSATTALPVPASGVGTRLDERVNDISCVDVRDCVVVGLLGRTVAETEASTGTTRPFVQTETNGVWGGPMIAPLPDDAETRDPLAELNAVACLPATAPGPPECVAVGSYELGTSAVRPLVLRYANAEWALGTKPSLSSLPTREGLLAVGLSSISCADDDACVAGGSVLTSQGPTGRHYAVDTLGQMTGFSSLARLSNVPAIGGAAPASSYVSGVACPMGQATCTAVGVAQEGRETVPFSVPLALAG